MIPMTQQKDALAQFLQYPLSSAISHRRSRRISQGIHSVLAGTLSYKSDESPHPLDPLEEALLIVATGATGITMPDMPFLTENNQPLAGSPMLEIIGRAASSPDNSQATHFFMLNDSGTYLIKRPASAISLPLEEVLADPDKLISLAESYKVKVLDHRLDFPREFPCYLGRNRYVSNVPGSTVFLPVVDMTRQYINGLMFLLTQEDGQRPTFIDDWNFYRKAGVCKWVKSGFVNEDLPIPLGMMNTFRIHVEAELLIQNLLLTIQAMGLGGWVHAGFPGPVLLGDADYRDKYGPGLNFRFHVPQKPFRKLLTAITPLPAWRPNPVGLDGLLEGLCPPYFASMKDAMDALLATKYGPNGVYSNEKLLENVFKPGYAKPFIEEVPHYSPEVIECALDVCNYIYDTYGRFPAHVDAMYVPGIWVQAHHLDLKYYDYLYKNGYSRTQADHDHLWHGKS